MTPTLSNPVKLLSVGLVFAVIICVALVFLLVDRSISYAYLHASLDKVVENSDLLNSLLENEWLGTSEQEVLEKLKSEVVRREGKEVIVIDANSEQGVIWFNEVRFEFHSGKLKKIDM